MARNIEHIVVLDKAVGHLDQNLTLVHNKLSQLYTLLNRPISGISQEQALSLLHNSMSIVRQIQEDKSYIVNSAVGFDNDIERIIAELNKLRIPRAMDTKVADETYPMQSFTPSPLRDAAENLDDLIQRGNLNRANELG